MATISFRDFTLNQTTIIGKRKQEVIVVDARCRYKIDPETHQRTQDIEGYAVDIIAARGRTQTVKLPSAVEKTVEEIIGNLKQNKIVKVNFGEPSTLTGRVYAMLSNGIINSGVSASATAINIVSIEEDEDYTDDIVDI